MAASESAKRWPRKQGKNFIRDCDISAREAAELLRQTPKLAKRGDPCVAVAMLRAHGNPSGSDLEEALIDLANMFSEEPQTFVQMLGDSPAALAKRLSEMAVAQKPKGGSDDGGD